MLTEENFTISLFFLFYFLLLQLVNVANTHETLQPADISTTVKQITVTFQYILCHYFYKQLLVVFCFIL